jgi:hypothetical protein
MNKDRLHAWRLLSSPNNARLALMLACFLRTRLQDCYIVVAGLFDRSSEQHMQQHNRSSDQSTLLNMFAEQHKRLNVRSAEQYLLLNRSAKQQHPQVNRSAEQHVFPDASQLLAAQLRQGAEARQAARQRRQNDKLGGHDPQHAQKVRCGLRAMARALTFYFRGLLGV